ncbi:MAG: hypothetical protein UHY68_00260 [Acutalibacteraceae bacterium]|nr:hypothetical protein [Acutalibacteraceae bacterium]
MNNKFLNKTTGIIIIASMLCTAFTVGCTKTDSNADDKETATQAVTETATEKATEATTEITTETTVSTESKDGVLTIKAKPNTNSFDFGFDYGITVEGTDTDYKFLKTINIKDSEKEYEITDPSIKEIFDISMQYKIHRDNLSVEDVFITELKETVKVSIPYDTEGLYVVASKNGVAYDVNAEYIDGKYVFETDTLGGFIFRAEPIGRTEPVKTENVELAQQTITDERTGIQVSGMLPVDAKMDVSVDLVYESEFFYKMDAGEYTFEGDYPKATNVADCYIKYTEEKNIDDIKEIITEEGWSEFEDFAGDKIQLYINFVKDFEILDFESDLTVTLPLDYRQNLITGKLTGETIAVKYDYDKKGFVNLEVLPDKEDDGKFEFKTNTPGNFFFGDTSSINRFMRFYEREILSE